MPVPGDYQYDPRDNTAINARAERAYKEALRTWERVMLQFAQTHVVENDPPDQGSTS